MPVQMPKPPPSHGPGAAGIISAAATNAAAAAAAAAANTTEAAASGGAPRPPIDRLCTLYIARIPDGVSDETMLALLETCGRVKRWQRPTDPYTGRPRTYGFCDWAPPASVLRARRVLPGAVKFVRPAGGGAIGEAEAAPLLWRLDYYGIDLSKNAVPLLKYAERIFSRPAYIEALTPSEKVMRK